MGGSAYASAIEACLRAVSYKAICTGTGGCFVNLPNESLKKGVVLRAFGFEVAIAFFSFLLFLAGLCSFGHSIVNPSRFWILAKFACLSSINRLCAVRPSVH